MALTKQIELPSGITVGYHRVVSLNIITNHVNLVEVASYTSVAKRGEEQEALAMGAPMDVFIHTATYEAPYDQSMTVESAYEWVKTLPQFEGAEDVRADG